MLFYKNFEKIKSQKIHFKLILTQNSFVEYIFYYSSFYVTTPLKTIGEHGACEHAPSVYKICHMDGGSTKLISLIKEEICSSVRFDNCG